jgi:hypothetical protein
MRHDRGHEIQHAYGQHIAFTSRFPSPVLPGSGSKGFSQRNRTPSEVISYVEVPGNASINWYKAAIGSTWLLVINDFWGTTPEGCQLFFFH